MLPARDFESRASTNSAIPARDGDYPPNVRTAATGAQRPTRIIRAMLLDDFDYHLPEELIAQAPAAERSASRLLHLDGVTGALRDRRFADVLELLQPGDLLVLNDTRVIKARLTGRKATGGQIEVLIERVLDQHEALAQIRASHAPKAGAMLLLGEAIEAEVLGRVG